MEKRDLIIVKYLSKGFKITEIKEQMEKDHAIIMSESLLKNA